jgi:hypothetical protein
MVFCALSEAKGMYINMKKYMVILIITGWLLTGLTGCQAVGEPSAVAVENAADQSDGAGGQNDIQYQGGVALLGSNDEADGENVDLDLTAMSSTMVYGEVFNMTQYPEDYLGKTVKADGQYVPSYYDATGTTYHYVLIADAAACCQQGLEFIWQGSHTYPDDYPAKAVDIEVTGVYSSYEELGMTYYYLAVDEIVEQQ